MPPRSRLLASSGSRLHAVRVSDDSGDVCPERNARDDIPPAFPLMKQCTLPTSLSLVPLKKLFQLLFAVFASIHLAGGPYALVQTYAWAGMLVSYSKEDGLLRGAKETFSGEKPCALCCKIAEAKRSGSDHKSQEPPVSPTVKLLKEMLPSSPLALAPPRFTEAPKAMFPGMIPPVETTASAPPVPPPRSAA